VSQGFGSCGAVVNIDGGPVVGFGSWGRRLKKNQDKHKRRDG